MALPVEPTVAIPLWATVLQAGGDGNNNRYDYMDETDDHIEKGWDHEEIPPYDIQNHQQYAVGEWLTWGYDSIVDLDGRVTVVEAIDGTFRRTATRVVAASDSQDTTNADAVATESSAEDAINTAIQALPAAGGTVFLRSGSYSVDGPIIIDRDYVRIVGEDRDSVLIQLDAAVAVPTNVLEIYNDTPTQVDKVELRNLTIHGNRGAAANSQYGIYANNATQIYIENCNIFNSKNAGLLLTDVQQLRVQNSIFWQCGSALGGMIQSTGSACNRTFIDACEFWLDASPTCGGILVGTIDKITVRDCYIVASHEHAINLTSCDDILIENCYIGKSEDAYDAIRVSDVTNWKVLGCTIDQEDTGWHGIFNINSASLYGIIEGNIIHNTKEEAIQIQGQHVTVNANTLWSVGTAGTKANAISFETAADSAVISNNNIYNAGYSAIYLPSNDAIVCGNYCEAYSIGTSGYSGIWVTADADGALIYGNRLWRGLIAEPLYGIEFAANSGANKHHVCYGNYLYNSSQSDDSKADISVGALANVVFLPTTATKDEANYTKVT